MEGFSFKAATFNPNLDILEKSITMYEANYPETLKAAFIINASKMFRIVFNLIKRKIKHTTLEKIKVFGPSDWKKPLHEAVPVDILPPAWGGTNTRIEEGTGYDRTGICRGGEVPLYYQSVQPPQEIPGRYGNSVVMIMRIKGWMITTPSPSLP